jgi:hypothetical protein
MVLRSSYVEPPGGVIALYFECQPIGEESTSHSLIMMILSSEQTAHICADPGRKINTRTLLALQYRFDGMKIYSNLRGHAGAASSNL